MPLRFTCNHNQSEVFDNATVLLPVSLVGIDFFEVDTSGIGLKWIVPSILRRICYQIPVHVSVYAAAYLVHECGSRGEASNGQSGGAKCSSKKYRTRQTQAPLRGCGKCKPVERQQEHSALSDTVGSQQALKCYTSMSALMCKSRSRQFSRGATHSHHYATYVAFQFVSDARVIYLCYDRTPSDSAHCIIA